MSSCNMWVEDQCLHIDKETKNLEGYSIKNVKIVFFDDYVSHLIIEKPKENFSKVKTKNQETILKEITDLDDKIFEYFSNVLK